MKIYFTLSNRNEILMAKAINYLDFVKKINNLESSLKVLSSPFGFINVDLSQRFWRSQKKCHSKGRKLYFFFWFLNSRIFARDFFGKGWGILEKCYILDELLLDYHISTYVSYVKQYLGGLFILYLSYFNYLKKILRS